MNINAKRTNLNRASSTHTRIGVFDNGERFVVRHLAQHENPKFLFHESVQHDEMDFPVDLAERQRKLLEKALNENRVTIESIKKALMESSSNFGATIKIPVGASM